MEFKLKVISLVFPLNVPTVPKYFFNRLLVACSVVNYLTMLFVMFSFVVVHVNTLLIDVGKSMRLYPSKLVQAPSGLVFY